MTISVDVTAAPVGVSVSPSGVVTIGSSVPTGVGVSVIDAPQWSEVTGKPSTFPPSAHSHLASEVALGFDSDMFQNFDTVEVAFGVVEESLNARAALTHASTHDQSGSDPLYIGASQIYSAADTDHFSTDDTVSVALSNLSNALTSAATDPVSLSRLPVTVEKATSLGNSGASRTLSLSAASVQTVTLNSNCTFTMPLVVAGASLTLIVTQGGAGNTATFTGVRWPGGAAPTITATNGKVDVIRFVSNGTNWFGSISQNY